MMRVIAVCCAVAIALPAASCTNGDPAPTATHDEAPPASSTTTSETDVDSVPALDWVSCGEAECSVLTVPLDHDDPSAGTIDLRVARRLADQPDQRIGVLFYNPGGAGAAGIPFVEAASASFGSELLRRFDLVSWDPRGVSAGTELDCFDDPNEFFALDPTPESDEEVEQVTARLRSFAAACAERSGNLLPHLSTMATARDMDQLRRVLGEEQISYLGQSYGTALGLAYATLYPNRLRAMALDGIYDLNAPLDEFVATRAEAEFAVLGAALAECAGDEFCPFHNGGDPSGALNDLLGSLDDSPLVVGDAELSHLRALDAIWWSLLSEEYWPALAEGLARAQQGDGELLLSWSQLDADAGPLGLAGWYGINCLDRPREQRSLTDEQYARIVAASPWLGVDEWMGNVVCRYWGAEPEPPPPPAPGDAPILIVSATGDTATPLPSGLALSRRLDHARLLIAEQNSHNSYAPILPGGIVDGEAECVTSVVHRFLVDLQLPADQSVCVHGQGRLLPPGSIVGVP